MSEIRSALARLQHPPRPAEIGASLREHRPGAIVQVQAWPDTATRVAGILAELVGVGPPALGRANGDDAMLVAAVGPGRVLVIAEHADFGAKLEAALPSAEAAVTDLTHSRTMLRLEGAGAHRIVSKGVAIDLAPEAFPPGRVALSAIHHIGILLHRRSQTTFDLLVFRSFAASMAEWLLDAGLEYGIGFDRP